MEINEFIKINEESDEGHFHHHTKERSVKLINKILQIYDLNELTKKEILIYGDGIGLIGGFLANIGCKVTSIEARNYNVNIAKIRSKVPYTILKKDYKELSIKKDTFDLIICFGFVEVIDDLEILLKQWIKVKEILFENIILDSEKQIINKFIWTAGNDRPIDSYGTIPTSNYIEYKMCDLGYDVERYFDSDINYGNNKTRYDWTKMKNKVNLDKRRFWRFVRK